MDDTHAFFQPTNLMMYPEGHLDAPSVLEVVPFPGWSVHCPLPRTRAGKNTFVAASYDILADSPVEAGMHRTGTFVVDGKRHEIVVHGIGGFDMGMMEKDFARIVRAAKGHFGNTLPYDNYTFILHFLPGNRGGLEHLNSQVSAWPSGNCETREQYEDFLSLVSHEFFHLWNVKRIRPSILGPFDYTREQYTDQLWVMEGITTYYEWLVLARAGLVGRDRVMRAFDAELNRWDERPGNAVMPLDESGRLAWTKLYLADENFVNTGVSYYLKGFLVAGLLDMEIRTRTLGRKHPLSLDDVMLRLYQDYGWPKPGFPEGRFEQVVEEVTGLDLSREWRDWLHSTKPLPLEAWFEAVGYMIGREPVVRTGPDGTPVEVKSSPWIGWDVRTGTAGVTVTAVRAGSPAGEGGISARDEVIAMNGLRVASAGELDQLVRGIRPGQPLEVTLFRDSRLLTRVIRAVARPAGKIKLMPVPQPTRKQHVLLEAWLNPRI
jgi:predicted metalloprotease with PDZ domain